MRKLKIRYLPPHIREKLSKVTALYTDERENWVAICSNGDYLSGDDKELTPTHANCIELKSLFKRAFTDIDSSDIDELDKVVGCSELVSIFGSKEYNKMIKNKEYIEKQYAALVALNEQQRNVSSNNRLTKQTVYGVSFLPEVSLDQKIASISEAIDYYIEQLAKRIDNLFENYDKEKGANLDNGTYIDYSKNARENVYSNKIQSRLRTISNDKSSEQSLEAERITAEYLKIKGIQAEFKKFCEQSIPQEQVVSKRNTDNIRKKQRIF